jgi:glutathione peroxidase
MKTILIAFIYILFSTQSFAEEAKMSKLNAHQFSFTDIDGKDMPLSQFNGKTILIINTATGCGFAKQLSEMEKLWDKYKDKGLIVIGVPSNDFGGQQPGTDAEIKDICTKNFGTSFPLTTKTKVSGADSHPFYKWASEQTNFLGTPKWNFHKYLISPQGDFIDYFSSTTSPTSQSITNAIEKSLRKN